jgi:hypothetical protein
MSATDGRIDRIRALIAREPLPHDCPGGIAGRLRVLCLVTAHTLAARGVAVSLMTEIGPTGVVAALDEESEAIEELQFVCGEGPCWEAFETRAAVIAPDLRGDAARQWPGFSAAVQAHGVRSAVALPLQVGAARLGVLDIYRERPGAPDGGALAKAGALASIATLALLDGQSSADAGASPVGIEQALASRFVVYQAQGMVMIQLGVPMGEAMARMRAYAYAHDRTLGVVARDIVNRMLRLEVDAR